MRTRNPLNIGAVARAMANFGSSQLRLVAPYDLAFREARSAVGASELLANAEVCQSVAEAVADCDARHWHNRSYKSQRKPSAD